MKHYEIFLDRNRQLVLNSYDDKNPSRVDKVAQKTDVYYYLMKMAEYPVKSVDIYGKGDEPKDLTINFDNFKVDLFDCDKLDSYKTILSPIVNKASKKISEDRIKKIKTARQQKNLNATPKVKRTNKHSGSEIMAGTIAIMMIATSAYFVLNSKADETNIDIPSSNVEVIEITDEDKTSQYSGDDIVFVDVKTDNKLSNVNTININYEDRSNTEKAKKTKKLYGAIIEQYASDYGLDPALVTAIATQERGVHSNVMDKGGATGLMQIQNSVWVGHEVSAYNFNEEKKETLSITTDMLGDVNTNIKIGCMILQNAMEYMDYNVLAGIQCYNMGYGNMNKVLTECASKTGATKQEILKDPNNTSWMEYRDIIPVGDQNYVEHVLSWIGPNVNVKVNANDEKISVLSCNNITNDVKVY